MGWLIFLGIFILGVLLIASALVYVIMTGGADERALAPRVLALSGIILVFGAIYGSAAWRFSLWWRTRDKEPSPEQNSRQ